MGKNHLLFSLTLAAAMGAGVNAEAKRVWDFTQGFSAETIEALTNDAMGTWYDNGDGTFGNLLNDWSSSAIDSLCYYREVSADSVAKVAIAETQGLLFNAPNYVYIGNGLGTPCLCFYDSYAEVNIPLVPAGAMITIVTSTQNAEASTRATGTTTGVVCTSDNATLVSSEETETGTVSKFVVSGNADEVQTVSFAPDGNTDMLYLYSITVLDMNDVSDLAVELDTQTAALAAAIAQLQESGMTQAAAELRLVADQAAGADRESADALRTALDAVNEGLTLSANALDTHANLGALVAECEALMAERPSDDLSAAIAAAQDVQANLASASIETIASAYATLRTAKNVYIASAFRYEDFTFSRQASIGGMRYQFDETHKMAILQDGNSETPDLTIPDAVEYEGEDYIVIGIGISSYQVFSSSPRSVSLPATVKRINAYAFNGCTLLESINLPASVDSIGVGAFSGCTALRSIAIPDKVRTLGTNTFNGCTQLREITLPTALTTIGQNAFRDCGMESIALPDSVRTIGNNAFDGCANLREVVLSDSLTSIGNYAFRGCSALKELTLPERLTEVGSAAFSGVSLDKLTSLATVPPTLSSSFNDLYTVFVPDGAGDSYRAADIWEDYIIVEGELLALDIHVDVPGTLGRKVLAEAENLEDVNIITLSGSLNDDDIYDIQNRLTSLLEIDMAGTDMTEMPASMFEGRRALQKIVLPAGLQAIGGDAMTECRSLRAIDLPESLTTIGSNAFAYCPLLESITIPEGVTSLGESAFSGCDSLKAVTLPSTLMAIPRNAFSGARALQTLNLAEGLQSIGSTAFSTAENLKEVKLPSTLQTIEDYAFSGCTSLTEVTLPGDVTYCGNFAFPPTVKTMTCLAVIPPALQSNRCPISSSGSYEGYTLYVPNLSLVDYKLTEGWDVLDIKGINSLPADITVHSDYVLNLPDTTLMTFDADSQLVPYKPNVIISNNQNGQRASLTVNGTSTLSMGLFQMTLDPRSYQNNNFNSDAYRYYNRLVSNAPMRADSVVTTLFMQNNQWEFLTFPYDVKVSDILPSDAQTSWVIRRYDGAARAAAESGSTWKDMTVDSVLHAGVGYIWQTYSPSGNYSAFTVPAENGVNKNLVFANDTRSIALAEHPAEFSHNRSWNLVGNPFPCFYDTRYMDFGAPFTVWNANEQTYEAYSPVDDSYILRPGEAFFVQRPVDMDAISFPTEGRQTDMTARTMSYAPRLGGKATTAREVFNLSLTDGKRTDRTRFVINDAASAAYDMATDAGKFESSDKDVAQLYTLENGVRMAINERPMGNSRVALGAYFGQAGSYTLTLDTRSTMNVLLIDRLTGKATDLRKGAYTFTAEAGTDENRFEIRLSRTATGIGGVADATGKTVTAANGLIKVETDRATDIAVFNVGGQKVASAHASTATFDVAPGLYIVTVSGHSYKVNVNK